MNVNALADALIRYQRFIECRAALKEQRRMKQKGGLNPDHREELPITNHQLITKAAAAGCTATTAQSKEGQNYDDDSTTAI